MDDVLPKSELSTCFRSKANVKANISIKLHPVTKGGVSTAEARGADNISPQKKVTTGWYWLWSYRKYEQRNNKNAWFPGSSLSGLNICCFSLFKNISLGLEYWLNKTRQGRSKWPQWLVKRMISLIIIVIKVRHLKEDKASKIPPLVGQTLTFEDNYVKNNPLFFLDSRLIMRWKNGLISRW